MARLVDSENRNDAQWILDDGDVDLAIRQISNSDIQRLIIDGLSDFGIGNLDFLRELPNLKYLSVWSKAPIDVTAIGACSYLEELSLDDQISIGLDLTCLRNLRDLRLIISKHQPLLVGNMPSMESLWIWKSGESDMTCLKSFPNLETLGIFEAKKLASLKGISNCSKLKRLDVGYCPLLSDTTELKTLSYLEHVELLSLKRLLSFVGDLPESSLKKLIVKGLPPISSASVFLRFLSIELLTLVNTEVLDGDLSPLVQIQSLKHCHIRPNKTQYQPKASDLYDLIKTKGAVAY